MRVPISDGGGGYLTCGDDEPADSAFHGQVRRVIPHPRFLCNHRRAGYHLKPLNPSLR